jgi:hypothetical protein
MESAPLLSASDIDMYVFSQNGDKNLPCIVFGMDSNNLTESHLPHHYTVEGTATVIFNGYKDRTNVLGSDIYDKLYYELSNKTPLLSWINYNPNRPETELFCHELKIRGESSVIDEKSTVLSINFAAWCIPKNKA